MILHRYTLSVTLILFAGCNVQVVDPVYYPAKWIVNQRATIPGKDETGDKPEFSGVAFSRAGVAWTDDKHKEGSCVLRLGNAFSHSLDIEAGSYFYTRWKTDVRVDGKAQGAVYEIRANKSARLYHQNSLSDLRDPSSQGYTIDLYSPKGERVEGVLNEGLHCRFPAPGQDSPTSLQAMLGKTLSMTYWIAPPRNPKQPVQKN